MRILLVSVLLVFILGCARSEPAKEVGNGPRPAQQKPAEQKNGQRGWEQTHATAQAVALSDDGKRALVGYKNINANPHLLLRLWDAEKGELIRTLEGHQASVFFVGFRPDGKTAVSAGCDGRINIYSAETGDLIRSITAYKQYMGVHDRGEGGFALSADGRVALTQGADADDLPGLIRLWNIDTGEMIRGLGLTHHVYYLAISPDKKFGLFGNYTWHRDRQVPLQNLETGEIVHWFEESDGWSPPVAFSVDGKYAMLGKLPREGNRPARQGTNPTHLALWDLAERKVVREFPLKVVFAENVFFPQLLLLDKHLVIPSATHKRNWDLLHLSFWDLENGKEIRCVTLEPGIAIPPPGEGHTVEALALSRDGKTALISARRADVHIMQIWNLDTGKLLRRWHEIPAW